MSRFFEFNPADAAPTNELVDPPRRLSPSDFARCRTKWVRHWPEIATFYQREKTLHDIAIESGTFGDHKIDLRWRPGLGEDAGVSWTCSCGVSTAQWYARNGAAWDHGIEHLRGIREQEAVIDANADAKMLLDKAIDSTRAQLKKPCLRPRCIHEARRGRQYCSTECWRVDWVPQVLASGIRGNSGRYPLGEAGSVFVGLYPAVGHTRIAAVPNFQFQRGAQIVCARGDIDNDEGGV